MTPVTQTIFGADSGNCLSASIASILDLPISEVPDFARLHGDDFEKAAVDWLRSRGLRVIQIGFACYETFVNTYFDCPGEFCVLSGPSTIPERGHAVVGRVNDRGMIDVAHDPMPGSDGNGPRCGYRWVRFIVPASSSSGGGASSGGAGKGGET